MLKSAQELEKEAENLKHQAMQMQGLHNWLDASANPEPPGSAAIEEQLSQYQVAIVTLHKQAKEKVKDYTFYFVLSTLRII